MRAFRLNKPLPYLERDVVFVYDQFNKSGLGSPGSGCLILAWENGGCQGNWCGATYILPGQCIGDFESFTEIENPPGRDGKELQYYVHLKEHKFIQVS